MQGLGTAESPYVITTVQELQDIENNLSAHYILGNDIDASDTVNWNDGAGFNPIGTNLSPFTGSLDGMGFSISNLYMNRESQSSTALFGSVKGAVIQNLRIDSPVVIGGSYSSALASHAREGSAISQCAVIDANVTGSYYSSLFVSSIDGATIEDSYTSGNVTSQASSSATFVGDIRSNYTVIKNCYSSGTIEYYASKAFAGSVQDSPKISGCFWDSDLYWGRIVDHSGIEGKTTAEMKSQSTYVDWDFENVWYVDEGNSYPELRIFKTTTPPEKTTKKYCYKSVCQAAINKSFQALSNQRLGRYRKNNFLAEHTCGVCNNTYYLPKLILGIQFYNKFQTSTIIALQKNYKARASLQLAIEVVSQNQSLYIIGESNTVSAECHNCFALNKVRNVLFIGNVGNSSSNGAKTNFKIGVPTKTARILQVQIGINAEEQFDKQVFLGRAQSEKTYIKLYISKTSKYIANSLIKASERNCVTHNSSQITGITRPRKQTTEYIVGHLNSRDFLSTYIQGVKSSTLVAAQYIISLNANMVVFVPIVIKAEVSNDEAFKTKVNIAQTIQKYAKSKASIGKTSLIENNSILKAGYKNILQKHNEIYAGFRGSSVEFTILKNGFSSSETFSTKSNVGTKALRYISVLSFLSVLAKKVYFSNVSNVGLVCKRLKVLKSSIGLSRVVAKQARESVALKTYHKNYTRYYIANTNFKYIFNSIYIGKQVQDEKKSFYRIGFNSRNNFYHKQKLGKISKKTLPIIFIASLEDSILITTAFKSNGSVSAILSLTLSMLAKTSSKGTIDIFSDRIIFMSGSNKLAGNALLDSNLFNLTELSSFANVRFINYDVTKEHRLSNTSARLNIKGGAKSIVNKELSKVNYPPLKL